MNIALTALISLVVVIALGRFSRLNVGIAAMGFAWLIGYYLAGMSVSTLVAGFPVGLFTILFGVTLLFSAAQLNGTLDQIAQAALYAIKAKRGLLPLIFFGLALMLASIGPGNIAAVVLLAPIAMTIAGKVGISAFLMTLMVANGANAGAFSPLAPTGIIANGLIAQLGLTMNPWTQVYLPSFLVQSVIALLGYLLFGGLQLWQTDATSRSFDIAEIAGKRTPLTLSQALTLIAIAMLIIGVALFKADAGFLALCLSTGLALLGAADQEAAIKSVPWSSILMVCGIGLLISILAETGGLDLFTTLLARVSTVANVTGVIAFVTGMLSTYSSSSGVVMPMFIPLVPELIAKLGGGNAVAIVSAINVGSHVVDVSPLSTLGAICIANMAAHEDKNKLFRHLLTYGLAMAVFGALLCYVFFGLLLS